jgi:hypothetical protein
MSHVSTRNTATKMQEVLEGVVLNAGRTFSKKLIKISAVPDIVNSARGKGRVEQGRAEVVPSFGLDQPPVLCSKSRSACSYSECRPGERGTGNEACSFQIYLDHGNDRKVCLNTSLASMS